MTVSRAEAIRRLTAPGAPLEVRETLEGGWPVRRFTRAPESISALLDQAVSSFGERTYTAYEGQRRTFREVDEEASRLAKGLQDLAGVRRGDRVAIAMRNYPEWVTGFLAVQKLGAVVVAMNAWWTARELEATLANAEPKVILADRERTARLPPGGAAIVEVRSPQPTRRDAVPYAGLLGGGRITANAEAGPSDDALIMYTSGSTAAPKGAVSTHGAVIQGLYAWKLDAAVNALMAGLPEPDYLRAPPGALLLPVPLFHVSGSQVGLLANLLYGRKLVLMYKWDPAAALDLIRSEEVTHFVGPAAVTGDLVREIAARGERFDSLQGVGGGGAPRPPEQLRAILAHVPTADAHIGWGMTETNGLGTSISGAAYRERPTSSGIGSPTLDLRIVAEDGAVLPAGETGELQVRGPAVFRGYWRMPEATAASFVDGWFRTGDLARLDDQGFLYIVDRLKDMVLRGGENISCPQVEAEIAEHPDVAEAAVFGVPDERLGERLVGVVCERPGARIAGEDIQAFLRSRLAAFQIPETVQVRPDPLPRTASGKIAKRILLQEWLGADAADPPADAARRGAIAPGPTY